MNTTSCNQNNYLEIAEKYYEHLLNKNFNAMAECLHPEVDFIGPLTEMSGRKPVVSAAKNLSQILETIEIRSKFINNDQIMLAYDFIFPDPIEKLRAAVLMNFKNNQISKIELFYDGRPFEQKKKEIFENK